MPLTSSWTQLRYHALQARLWRTKKQFVAVAAGRGSGKTELARRRVVRFLAVKKAHPDPIYFYALPTIAQAKRVAWKPLKNLVPTDWIRKINESEMTIETKFGSTLYVCGMDKPQRIEGVQWDGGVLDESSDQRPDAFRISVLPALSHKRGWCWRIGVPKRHGIGAKDFKEFFDKEDVDAYSWHSGTVLTPEQLSWAQDNLDEDDYNEQYGADWITAGGLAFHAYDDKLNTFENIELSRDLPIIVGSDFNVDPMAWVIAQYWPPIDTFYVFDELFIRNTNTQAALNRLYIKYGSHPSGFRFYGDATGRARKTSASISDYLIIKSDTRFVGAQTFYNNANPRILDRLAACNAMFCNAKGVRRLMVHKRCKNLRTDLLNRAFKEGSNELDDSGDIGHISDALGYPIHRMFPVRYHFTDKQAQVGTHSC